MHNDKDEIDRLKGRIWPQKLIKEERIEKGVGDGEGELCEILADQIRGYGEMA